MPSARPSPLATLATLLWPLFLACTVLLVAVWLSGFGPGVIADPDFAHRVPNADLRAALAMLSRTIDPVWITLGAVNVYLAIAHAEGLNVARRWCGMILASSFVITFASAATGFPLGAVYFPTNLGPKLGLVPFALPFLWLLIIAGARDTVMRAFPRWSHAAYAPLTGIAAATTAALVDPTAWKLRAWWLWYPARVDAPHHLPWGSVLTWLVVGSSLAFGMRSERVIPQAGSRTGTPMWAYLLLNSAAVLTVLIR